MILMSSFRYIFAGYRMPSPECATPEIYRLMLGIFRIFPIENTPDSII